MSIIVDLQFAERVRPYVKNFKARGQYMWSMTCPYCGDSSKNKSASKAGVYRRTDKLLFNCFKCGTSTTLGNFIKSLDAQLYKEYRFAEFKEEKEIAHSDDDDVEVDESFFKKSSRQLPISDTTLDKLVPISQLPITHKAVQYIVGRKIPKDKWKLFFYTEQYKQYVESIIPGKFETLKNDCPRIVLPFYDQHGRVFAFTGRSLNGEEPKYITIKLKEDEERIYGRERLDYSKLIFVVEGQIDSLLLPNAVSVSGSSFDTPYIRGIKTNCILVPDFEPRHPQIVKLYEKYIDEGYRVCMLPDSFPGKDINEAVIAGMTSDEIAKLILENSYQGITAKLKFGQWKRR